MLLCADLWKRQETLYAAYHDREGVTEAFIKNGIRHALGSLGNAAAADSANWDYEVRRLHAHGSRVLELAQP